MPLMQLKHVDVVFEEKTGSFSTRKFYAVKDVSLDINEGDNLIVVGESGAGKSTLGRVIVGLQRPTSGQVLFKGYDIWRQKKRIAKEYRKSVQLVPQDPYSTLPYNKTVETILSVPIKTWKKLKGNELEKEIKRLLTLVKLTPPEEFLNKYPFQLSGGQRQRLNIARSLSVDPKLIVADEPVTMIDASMRISILNVLAEIKKELNLALVFITHDLSLARYFGYITGKGRTIVMFAGRIVEEGNIEDIIRTPLHPYTQDLITLAPDISTRKMESLREIRITYERVTGGCRYRERCRYAMPMCAKDEPALVKYGDSRAVACFLYSQQKKE